MDARDRRWWATPSSADDDDAPVIFHDVDQTIADLNRRDGADGAQWGVLFEQWQRIKEPLLSTLFAPFPPLRGPVRLLRELGTAEALRLAHLLLLPAGVMAETLFDGDAARLLLLGNAMHADVPIDAPGSAVMGYLLSMMAQDGGFPVPVGGRGAVDGRAGQPGALGRCRTSSANARSMRSRFAVIARWRYTPPTARRSVYAGLW